MGNPRLPSPTNAEGARKATEVYYYGLSRHGVYQSRIVKNDGWVLLITNINHTTGRIINQSIKPR